MSAKMLAAALTAIAVLALVPPAAATWEHRRRMTRAASDAAAVAERLRACTRDPRVAAGPGSLPVTPGGGSIENVTIQSEVCGLSLRSDPWGNGYVIGADWVLSAGANGIVETPVPPLAGATALGDDVLAGR